MPAELLNEMFAALPLENAFGILAKMANGLLARNVRKMLESVEKAMRNNKWNPVDCGPIGIYGGGMGAKHNGPNYPTGVRAILPIPNFNLNDKKPSIAAYFEVEIVSKRQFGWCQIGIGFCTKEFLLEGALGTKKNSIGTNNKIGIFINRGFKKFENPRILQYKFEVGDVVGIGLVHSSANSPMKCFCTLNGELLGIFELPHNFAALRLYPAFSLCYEGESIAANFGQEKWRFNLNQFANNLQ